MFLNECACTGFGQKAILIFAGACIECAFDSGGDMLRGLSGAPVWSRGSYLKTRVRGHAFASPEPLACMPSSMNSVPLDAGVVTLSIFCISQFTISVTVDILHC